MSERQCGPALMALLHVVSPLVLTCRRCVWVRLVRALSVLCMTWVGLADLALALRVARTWESLSRSPTSLSSPWPVLTVRWTVGPMLLGNWLRVTSVLRLALTAATGASSLRSVPWTNECRRLPDRLTWLSTVPSVVVRSVALVLGRLRSTCLMGRLGLSWVARWSTELRRVASPFDSC